MKTQTKLDWELFSPLFGSWANRIKPFFIKSGFDPIYAQLKSDRLRGKTICPLSENVFKAFKETPFEEVRAILCGFSPYHSLYNRKPIASGLLMDCSITGKLQPSLIKWYEELSRIYSTEVKQEPDLSYLARQGVLMLNAGLTTEALKPGSHNTLWEPFMKFLFEEVIVTTGIPVVFLGKESLRLEKYLTPFTWIFRLSHPASASYSNSEWSSEGMFKEVNRILKGSNNFEIKWYKTE
jgi:uracil-DNA glycosylase